MKLEKDVSYETLAKALFEAYECIYVIDLQTEAYSVYHESESYQRLHLTRSGNAFFKQLPIEVDMVVLDEDQEYVRNRLSREALIEGAKREKVYICTYRMKHNDTPQYHQARAVFSEVDGQQRILLGIKNIQYIVEQDVLYQREIEAGKQKENNYLDAILDTAVAYIEANIDTNEIIGHSVNQPSYIENKITTAIELGSINTYTGLVEWIDDNLVCENHDKYQAISSTTHLLRCYRKGEKRASVSFSISLRDGTIQPCKEIFYLYKELATGDIHALCVIYDLTEQQAQMREMEKLERELEMSRIRNSTSQMQPHFLYNALGSIQEVILTNPEYGAKLLEDFTVHLQGCIRAMDNDRPILFSQELENVRAYVNIEKMRFGDKLKMNYEIQEERFYVLPLCIQPLVENAIRHGIYERGSIGGEVTLRTYATPNYWVVEVEDNGVGFNVQAYLEDLRRGRTKSTGLKNIRFRMEKVLNAKVSIVSHVGVGTKVVVNIPKEGKR